MGVYESTKARLLALEKLNENQNMALHRNFDMQMQQKEKHDKQSSKTKFNVGELCDIN